MRKISVAFLAVIMLMPCFVFCASAAAEEYNYKGFQLFMPSEFVRDLKWAKKYGYVDYWHSEDYMIEMLFIDSDFSEEKFIEEHPDEPYYDCHIINDKLYGYSSEILSEEDIEINGNVGKKRTYRKKIQQSENSDWETVNVFSYAFEKGDKYYEVRFYVHHEVLYGFYPDMIMYDSFNISPFTFFLRNRTWILCLLITPVGFAIAESRRRKTE